MSQKSTKPLPPKLQAWVKARNRYRLSHAHVQMARELGLNPEKLGSLANHPQEPWKAPLPDFIERIYLKRFGRERPETVVPIGHQARQASRKNANKTAATPTDRTAADTTGDAARSSARDQQGRSARLDPSPPGLPVPGRPGA